MNSITTETVIPVVEVSNSTPRKEVRTPQIKANRKDKTRFKRNKLKDIAFEEYGVRTKQIKKYLNQLGYKLDLRLTAAWDAVVFELRSEIKALQVKLMENVEQSTNEKAEDDKSLDKAPKIIPPVPWRKPPAFNNDIEAMNWYLNENNQRPAESA